MTTSEGTFPGPRRTVVVAVEMVSVETAVWCDTCALSSAATAWYSITLNGRTTLHGKTVCEGDHS